MAETPDAIAKAALEAIAEIVALVNGAPRVPTELEELRALNAALREELAEVRDVLATTCQRHGITPVTDPTEPHGPTPAEEARDALSDQLTRIGTGLGQLMITADRKGKDTLRISEVQEVMQAASRDLSPSAGFQVAGEAMGQAMVDSLAQGIDDAQAVLNTRAGNERCANCGKTIIKWPPPKGESWRHVLGAERHCWNGAGPAVATPPAPVTPSENLERLAAIANTRPDTESETSWQPRV